MERSWDQPAQVILFMVIEWYMRCLEKMDVENSNWLQDL